jgi:hypothetical protein
MKDLFLKNDVMTIVIISVIYYGWLLAVGCWLLAVGCWLLAVGCWLCWLLAVGCVGCVGWWADAKANS